MFGVLVVCGWAVPVDAQLRISELLASNGGGLADENGDFQDWIEIENRTTVAVDLAGYRLDEGGAGWFFPSIVLGAGERLVVFASGKDRVDPVGEMHTDFALSASGGEVRLSDAAGALLDRIEFPRQRQDVSYGRDALGSLVYFRVPTPGGENVGVGQTAITPAPEFSIEHGFFTSPFHVALTAPGAAIRYTTDGTEPNLLNGHAYLGPVPVTATTVMRAAAYLPAALGSEVVGHSYVFAADVLGQPEMSRAVVEDPNYAAGLAAELASLPTLSLSLDEAAFFGEGGIYQDFTRRGREAEVPVGVEYFDQGGEEGFAINAGIRIHGGQARFHTKKPLRLYFRSEYGSSSLEYPLFPGSPVSTFKRLLLRPGGHDGMAIEWNSVDGNGSPRRDAEGNYILRGRNDLTETASYTRDEFLRRSEKDIGLLSPHGRFVQLFINGRYWGMYNLHERADEEFFASHGGGDAEDWDVVKQRGEIAAGDGDAWDELMARAAEGVLSSGDYEEFGALIESDGFIDAMITRLWSGDHDWLGPLRLHRRGSSQQFGSTTSPNNRNWFAGRRSRGGAADAPFQFFTWDAEISMGNDRFLNSGNRNMDFDFTAVNAQNSQSAPYAALAEFPEFRMRFADRLQRHLRDGGQLSPEVAKARLDRIVDEIRPAVATESARWGNIHGGVPVTRDVEWEAEVDWLRNRFVQERGGIVIDGPVDLSFEMGAFPGLTIVDSPPLSEMMRSAAVTSNPVTYHLGDAREFLEGGAIRVRLAVESGTNYKIQFFMPEMPGSEGVTHFFRLNGVRVDSATPGNIVVDPSGEGFLWVYQWLADSAEAEFEIDTRVSSNFVRTDPYQLALSGFTLEKLPGPVGAAVEEIAISSVGQGDFTGDFPYAVDLGGAGGMAVGAVSFVGCQYPGIDVAGAGVTVMAPPGHFRERGLFPEIETPQASPPGGQFGAPPAVVLDPLGQPGTLYFTTDGSDPRSPGDYLGRELVGGASPALNLIPSLANGGSGLGATWKDVVDPANIDQWRAGEAAVGYERDGDIFADLIRSDVGEMFETNASVYVRIPFDVDAGDLANLQRLVLSMRYDDGFAAYLNGELVAFGSAPIGITWNSTATILRPDSAALQPQNFDISSQLGLLVAGENVLAIQCLNIAANSSDLLLVPRLAAMVEGVAPGVAVGAQAYVGPIALSGTSTLKARLQHSNGEWSPLREESYRIGDRLPVAGDLVVSEIHYRPLGVQTPEEAAVGSSRSSFEFVEIGNVSATAFDLRGLRFIDGVEFDFALSPIASLESGEFVVVVADRQAFGARYGAAAAGRVVGVFAGGTKLSNGGERLAIGAADGETLFEVRYDDTSPWPEAPDGDGPSLELIDFLADPMRAANWRASATAGGTPGFDPTTFDSDGDDLPDAWEQRFFSGLAQTGGGDPDGDGLNNAEELAAGSDPSESDVDGDGLDDRHEVLVSGTDPNEADSDGDGVDDGDETGDPLVADTDGDGLDDGEEERLGTDPNQRDSDGDGRLDGEEVVAGGDPLDAGDRSGLAQGDVLIYSPLDTAPQAGGDVPNQAGAVGKVIDAGAAVGLIGGAYELAVAPGGFGYGHVADPGDAALTAMMWFMPDGLAPGTLLSKGASADGEGGWSIFLDGAGAVLFRVTVAGVSQTVSAPLGAGGGWRHVALVLRDAGSAVRAEAYLDGVEVGAIAGGAGAVRSHLPLSVGYHPELSGVFSGSLDDLMVTTVALGADQVAEVEAAGRWGMGALEALLSDGTDSDHDRLPDAWEIDQFGTLDEVAAGDVDGDGLTNREEYEIGSDPNERDGDGDGDEDPDEILAGSDPASSGEAAGAGIVDGLELYLSFDDRDRSDSSGTVTIFDLTSPPENGLLVGSTSSVAGREGEAIEFAGGSVQFGDVLDPGTDSYSVSLWVRPDSVGSGHSQLIAGKGADLGGGISGWGLYLIGDRYAAAGAFADGSQWMVRNAEAAAGTLAQAGSWTHVVFEIDRAAGMVRLFINGVEAGYGAEERQIVTGAGMDVDGALVVGGQSFGGAVDEMVIWRRILEADEIGALARAGSGRVSVGALGGMAGDPTLDVSPGLLEVVVNAGETGRGFIDVANPGGGILNWLLSIDPPGAISLEDALLRLDAEGGAVTDLIPDRYDFTEGESGSLIVSGGLDMFDAGNGISTDVENLIPYSDGVVMDGAGFGVGGRYFTRKIPGLFVLSADLGGISYLDISGNLGADGVGEVEVAELELERGTRRFRGFVKRVFDGFDANTNATDPSVNHLIIVEDDGSPIDQTVGSSTDDDGHRIDGLFSISRVYYLLFSSQDGRRLRDEEGLAIMDAFLDTIGVEDGWATAPVNAGAVVGAQAQGVAIDVDAAGLVPGDALETMLRLRSNGRPNEAAAVRLVMRVNSPPQVSPTPLVDLVFDEDDPARAVALFPAFDDADGAGDALDYEVVGNSSPDLFPGLGIDPVTGILSVEPARDQFGESEISLRATDANGLFVEQSFIARVLPVDDRPIGRPIGDVLADASATPVMIEISDFFSDADPGDVLRYGLVLMGDELFDVASLDPATGRLSLVFSPFAHGIANLVVRATDRSGLFAEEGFKVVLPKVVAPEVAIASEVATNRQTGLIEQRVTITNLAGRAVESARIRLEGLPPGVEVWNASARDPDGTPVIIYHKPLAPGESATVIVEYYSPDRRLTAVAVPVVTVSSRPSGLASSGERFVIDRLLVMDDGAVLVEFASEPGSRYVVQYSDDGVFWADAGLPTRAGGTRVQWIDRGPPKTRAHPTEVASRLYRVAKIAD